MKLELHGFRCHENIELEIEENQITLLSGSSGQGKSTILESLLFLLYDAVKKPFTFGKKKCKVVLHYQSSVITRQKNPNLLTVQTSDLKLENELAQQWIDNEFGNLDQFFCACYIRQMEKHFIFNQSSSEIIDFIQSLAFDKEHINEWKEKLNERRKEFEDSVNKYEGRIQQQEQLVQNDSIFEQLSREEIAKLQEKPIEKRQEEINEVEFEEKEKRFEKERKLELYHKHQAKKKEVQRLKENLESMTSYDHIELETEFNDIIEKLRVPVSSLKQELNLVKQEWNKMKKTIGPNTKVEQKLPLLLEEKRVMTRISEILDSVFFTKDYTEFENHLKHSKQELEHLEKRRSDLEISLKSIYWTKVTEFDCPVCNTHLFYSNDKVLTELEKPEHLEIPIPDASEKELGIVLNKIDILSSRIKQDEHAHEQIEELTKNIKWTQGLDSKIELYTKFLETTKKKDDLEAKAKNDNSLDIEQIQELENKRQEINKKLKSYHQYDILKQQYEAEKEYLNEMTKIKEEELQDVEKQINLIQQKKKKMEQEMKLLERVIQNNKENEILDQLYIEKRKWSQRLEACVFLKQKTHESEHLYLEEVLDQINLEMNHYLEFLFDKNPMTIRFKTIKEMKTKKESKPAFDMEIFFKNEQYDSINQLSGGESIKISLAILLTFNKILNSKFILLDESLNPLDSESRMKVVDLLKSTNKTCIIISHDEIAGVFDKVLNL